MMNSHIALKPLPTSPCQGRAGEGFPGGARYLGLPRLKTANLIATLASIVVPALLLPLAWHFHHPLFYGLRHLETPLLVGLPLWILIHRFHAWRTLSRRQHLRHSRAGGNPEDRLAVTPVALDSRLRGNDVKRSPASTALWILVLLVTLERGVEYRLQRDTVLAAGPSMQAVGQHFIVGYNDFDEVRELAAKGLIGGIYIGKRNVRGRSFDEVAAEIAELQAIRRRAELPPLIVAADQEGGPVSHLSPLLEALPPLASLNDAPDPAGAARTYGERQGRGLAALGVTLNFGPVVDLKPPGRASEDKLSNIPARAIASNPAQVETIAAAYLDGLAAQGVRGTLKHFPGLGRVRADTHLHPATLDQAPAQLTTDWQPFRQLGQRAGSTIMLGHVTLATLDPEHAASHSPAVVELLREHWGYDGLLLTDDLNMGAVYRLGIGRVAGEALAAGIDFVLVTYDPRQVYRALYGAAQALEKREITPARLAESQSRLAAWQSTRTVLAAKPSPKLASLPRHG